jgi:phosphoribosyl 1,2-cyclic phosphodiesterase
MSDRPRSSTRVKFWGVRGSIPVPGNSTIRYGGNTSCVEVRADDEIIVLDAGTGIRPLGVALGKEFGERPIKVTLLITHAHWDHIHGLPFFVPAHSEKNQITVYGPDTAAAGLREILESEMATPFFPVALHDLAGKIDIRTLEPGELLVGQVRVRAALVNHPGICVGYRLFTSQGSVAFLPDHEPYEIKLHSVRGESLPAAEIHQRAQEERALLVDFLRGSDLLILDAQYTDEEYKGRVSWGHGSLSSVVALARDAHVGKLMLFHHDPNHDDARVDDMLEAARSLARKTAPRLEVDAAREGTELVL